MIRKALSFKLPQTLEKVFIISNFFLWAVLLAIYLVCATSLLFGAGDFVWDLILDRDLDTRYVVSGIGVWVLHKRVVRFIRNRIIVRR